MLQSYNKSIIRRVTSEAGKRWTLWTIVLLVKYINVKKRSAFSLKTVETFCYCRGPLEILLILASFEIAVPVLSGLKEWKFAHLQYHGPQPMCRISSLRTPIGLEADTAIGETIIKSLENVQNMIFLLHDVLILTMISKLAVPRFVR